VNNGQAPSMVATSAMPHAATTVFVITAFIVVVLIVVLIVRALQRSDRYRALKKLRRLDAKELDAYFASYGKIFDDNTMISTLDDFRQGRPPSRFVIADDEKPSEYTAECYNILNYLCALGNVKKMYIPKCIDPSRSLVENQKLQEAEVAERLHASSDSTILELGCGCGRIAHHMTQLTGCTVHGVNIDETQLDDARAYAREKGCTRTHFLLSDFNDPLPFDDASIDGIYSFGGFITFVSDYDAVFAELHRVLKPGGRIVLSDGALLDAFDRTDERHLRLMSKARMLMAGGVFLHYRYPESIAARNGFTVELSRGGDDPERLASELPLLIREHAHFNIVEKVVRCLTAVRLLPAYMNDLLARLRDGGNDLVEMEQANLVTMDWDFVFVKDG